MKPWINLPFLIQQDKRLFLEDTIKALTSWNVDEMRIMVFLNETLEDTTELVDRIFCLSPNINIDVVKVTDNPMLLPWEHKKYLKYFLISDFTHFIYTDGDIAVPGAVFDYWIETREFFNKNGYERFIPGTFRIETFQGVDYSSDMTFRTNIDELPIVKIKDKYFFRPQEPFQGISIMDKELAWEHLDSPCFKPTMDQSIYKFGFIETCISAYILDNLPDGVHHRILIPLDDYERCWNYHLPANYAANPDSEHGKIAAHYIFDRINRRINGNY